MEQISNKKSPKRRRKNSRINTRCALTANDTRVKSNEYFHDDKKPYGNIRKNETFDTLLPRCVCVNIKIAAYTAVSLHY